MKTPKWTSDKSEMPNSPTRPDFSHSRDSLSDAVKQTSAACLNSTTSELVVTRLTGDASTRSYFRARLRRGDSHGIVIAAYAAPFDETQSAAARLEQLERDKPGARLSFANDPCAHVEVTRLLEEEGLPVPGILATLGREGAMFFEDVGDARLQDWIAEQAPAAVEQAYDRAVELIVSIQEATARADGSICSKLAFDHAKLSWEMDFFFENYFNRYLDARLSETAAVALKEEFGILCAELASRPRVLVHRDYHSRNLMMHRDRMFIIDLQDARMGPVSYDVASLLEDPYSTLTRSEVARLIERFLDLKSRSGAPLDRSEFVREYRLMTVQRMLKAVGTYSYQAGVLKNEVYVPYIEPAFRSALAALTELSDYPATRRMIEERC